MFERTQGARGVDRQIVRIWKHYQDISFPTTLISLGTLEPDTGSSAKGIDIQRLRSLTEHRAHRLRHTSEVSSRF